VEIKGDPFGSPQGESSAPQEQAKAQKIAAQMAQDSNRIQAEMRAMTRAGAAAGNDAIKKDKEDDDFKHKGRH
jgi:hypothetical protein